MRQFLALLRKILVLALITGSYATHSSAQCVDLYDDGEDCLRDMQNAFGNEYYYPVYTYYPEYTYNAPNRQKLNDQVANKITTNFYTVNQIEFDRSIRKIFKQYKLSGKITIAIVYLGDSEDNTLDIKYIVSKFVLLNKNQLTNDIKKEISNTLYYRFDNNIRQRVGQMLEDNELTLGGIGYDSIQIVIR